MKFSKQLNSIPKKARQYMNKYLRLFDKSSFWFKLIVFIALLLLFLHRYNQMNPSVEGFTQSKNYELKENDELYDEFYVDYYDKIVKDAYKTNFEFNEICHTTKPSKKHSNILDIGCGTGDLVKKFVKKGYKVKGIDKAAAMIDKAKKNTQVVNLWKKMH